MTQTSDRRSLEQIPPHSLELEFALIGSFLVSFSGQDALGVLEILSPEHFYDPTCKLIYAAIMELHRAFRPVDLSMVGDRLNSSGSLKAIGGRDGLVQIQMAAPLDTNPIAYAIEIKDKWIRRQLYEAHRKGAIAAYDTSTSLEECCAISESLVHDATKARHTGDGGLVQISELLSPAIANLEEVSQGNRTPGVPSGFRDLDALTLGFERSTLCIIAARPAMGKTTFALNVAVNVAKLGLPVAFFSLEMSKDQILVSRILSSAARIDSSRLRAGKINDSDWESIGLAAEGLSRLPLYLDDTPDITPSEIISKVLRLKSEVGQIGMVVVDYLQLMGGDSQSNNRVAELSKMTRQLKGLAGRIEAPVVALSQLNRGTESRTNHRPVMSDLRESGSIEQDASLILMPYRDEYYNPDTPDRGIAEIIVTKARNGPTGTAKLLFEPSFTTFRDLRNA